MFTFEVNLGDTSFSFVGTSWSVTSCFIQNFSIQAFSQSSPMACLPLWVTFLLLLLHCVVTPRNYSNTLSRIDSATSTQLLQETSPNALK